MTTANPWPEEPIRAFASIGTGAKDTKDRTSNGSYPFFVRSQTVERIDSWSFDGEAVLTAGDGVGTGKVFHYIDGRFDYHQRVYRISNFRTDVSGRYFFHQFSANFLERIASLTAKSSVDSVRMETIAGMQIPLPTRMEQDRIAIAIDDAGELVGQLRRVLAKKAAVKQATMQQLLTGSTRLLNFSGSWVTVKLGEIAVISDGTHQTPEYVDSGIPFYSVEHVTADDFTNTKFISAAAYEAMPVERRIERGDILMTRIGSIGDCKLVDWDVKASYYVSLALLKINDWVSAPFVAQYSELTEFQREVESHSLMSAIPRKINLGPISDNEIRLPPTRAEQDAIATALTEMDQEIVALRRRLKKAEAIKSAMTQALLTGRVRLPIQGAAV